MTDQPSITCPRCGKTSHHPTDVQEGYCSNCHAWSTLPRPSDLAVRRPEWRRMAQLPHLTFDELGALHDAIQNHMRLLGLFDKASEQVQVLYSLDTAVLEAKATIRHLETLVEAEERAPAVGIPGALPREGTDRVKTDALDQLAARRALATTRGLIDNSQLYAGSPMYYYCQYCGAESDEKPEGWFIHPPIRICEPCVILVEHGWHDGVQPEFPVRRPQDSP